MVLYHKWFTRESIRLSKVERCNYVDAMQQQVAQHLSQFYQHCQWIDATAQIVKIRVLTVPSIIDYIKHAPVQDFHTASQKLTVFNFFLNLQKALQREASNNFCSEESRKQWLVTKTKFLCDFKSKRLPVIWYTHIKPMQSSKFLIHFLLKYGSYSNEIELMRTGNICSAYVKAQLFSPENADASI